jgi:hypothetical protein
VQFTYIPSPKIFTVLGMSFSSFESMSGVSKNVS